MKIFHKQSSSKYFLSFVLCFRTNLQKQLQQLIHLYDLNIDKRSTELYGSEKLLKRETQVLEDWKQKLFSLDIVYNDIRAKKEAIEKKQSEARLLLYMMNHAARTIQRFYRGLLTERKQKKKKSKKGGKGKTK